MSKLGCLSLSILLLGFFEVITPAAAWADEAPPCPAVWATSPIPWTGPFAHEDMAVSGTSPSDVWVAGNDGNYEEEPAPVLAHMDGSQWSQVALPVSGAGSLAALATIAPTDVWAAGYLGPLDPTQRRALLLHWDGTSVHQADDPISGSGADASFLTDVGASASDNVWAVGQETTGGVTNAVAERWDGSAWTEHDPLVPTGGAIAVNAISTTGPDDVWIVGGRRNAHSRARALAEHWNGSAWRLVDMPGELGRGGSFNVSDVAEVARGDAWAAGTSSHRSHRVELLVDRWDGHAWTSVRPNGIPLRYGHPVTVATLGPDDVWISVNNRHQAQPYELLPFLHWDGSSLKQTVVPPSGINRFAVPVAPIGLAGPTELWAGARGWMCPVIVGDAGFSPQAASAEPDAQFRHLRRRQSIYPETVAFAVDPSSTGPHEVKDASGLGLFDSGSTPPGGSFTFPMTAAGTYPVVDPTSGATGTIAASVEVSPFKGNVALGFAVDAGQKRKRSDGRHVDMEIREPDSAEFLPWPAGNHGATGFGGADPMWTIPGAYTFRARLSDPVSGAATDWSPEATVKAKCCHAQVRQRGFYMTHSVSVVGAPFVWRVQDTTAHQHVVKDPSPFHLFRSATLTRGQSFTYTFKGAGTYNVVDGVQGFGGSILIRPQTSALFPSVGQSVRITAASGPPRAAWRHWRIQIERPGQTGFVTWKTGASAVFVPEQPGQFLFRSRLYDLHLGQGLRWSPVLTVRVQEGT